MLGLINKPASFKLDGNPFGNYLWSSQSTVEDVEMHWHLIQWRISDCIEVINDCILILCLLNWIFVSNLQFSNSNSLLHV